MQISGAASVTSSDATCQVNYQPRQDYFGNDVFSIRLQDALGAEARITVEVIIEPINDAPSVLTPPVIIGMPIIGETLLADGYDIVDVDSTGDIAVVLNWYRADDRNGSNRTRIAQNQPNYIITGQDQNRYLQAELIGSDASGATSTSPYYFVSSTAPSIEITPPPQIGVDQTLVLIASVTDDGAPRATPLITWRLLDGPAAVAFSDETNSVTAVEFLLPGTYTFVCQADDGLNVTAQQVTAVVTCASDRSQK